jgi:hypothetical protein
MSIGNVINFIANNIGDNTKFNTKKALNLLRVNDGEVEAKELEVDIEAAKLRLNKNIHGAKIVELRAFEISDWSEERGSDIAYYYMLTLNCEMNEIIDGERVAVKKDHTFYFRFFSNYPNMGYRLTEDRNYEVFEDGCGKEWLTDDHYLSYIIGWKYNLCGCYYSMI